MQEYVLVGPAESGLSGLPWETWGAGMDLGLSEGDIAVLGDRHDPKSRTMRSLQHGYMAAQRGELAPFAVDGFAKRRLDGLSALQICRRDCSPDMYGTSETWLFTRQEGVEEVACEGVRPLPPAPDPVYKE